MCLLEAENGKLKQLLDGVGIGRPHAAGAAPEKWITPAARQEAVHCIYEWWDFSERCACRLTGIHRSAARYERHGDDAPELR
jgi:hypothetical protein